MIVEMSPLRRMINQIRDLRIHPLVPYQRKPSKMVKMYHSNHLMQVTTLKKIKS